MPIMEQEASDSLDNAKRVHGEQPAPVPLQTTNEICRVCRCEGTKESPLFYPCLCSGSIKYVHQECLIQWLRHSRKTYCELCQHPFIFHPIYAENMPERLPLVVFARAMMKKLYRIMSYTMRYVFVMTIWLVLVPYLTYHLWKIYFGDIEWHESLGWSRSWVTECIEGGLLSMIIVGVFLCFIGLRDYLVLYGAQPDETHTGERHDPMIRRRQPPRRGILRHLRGRTRIEMARSPEFNRTTLPIRPNDSLSTNGTQEITNHDQSDMILPEEVPILGEHQRITVEEISLDQLVGLKGPWSMLLENVVWVVLFNLTFLGLFAFLPYHMGRTISSLMYSSFRLVTRKAISRTPYSSLSSVHETISMIPTYLIQKPLLVEKLMMIMLGYIMMATLLSKYLALDGIQQWAYRRYLSKMIHFLITLFYVFFKVSVLLLFEVGIFPVFCGFILDIATLRLFDATWASRMQLLGRSPTLGVFLHWIVGLSFMIHFSNFVRMLRDILRPGALWFLRNQNDPDYNAMKEMIDIPGTRHVFRLSISLFMYGIIILATFGIPLALVTFAVPGLLPLRWSAIDPFPEMPFDLLLFHVVLPFALKRLPLKKLAKSLLKHWFVFICRLLCLSSYILDSRHPEEESALGTVAELATFGRTRPQIYRSHPTIIRPTPLQRSGSTTTIYKPPSFGFRITCLIVLTWTTISLLLVTILLLPIYSGRMIFWRLFGLEVHDAYSFCVGLYVSCVIAHSFHEFFKDLWLPSEGSNLRENLPFMMLSSCRNMIIIGVFMGLVLPLLLGVLFDLTVTQPMRTILHESPVMLFFQDWALGLFFCKIARRVLLHSPESSLRQGFIDIRDHPWHTIPISSVLRKLFLPLSFSLMALIGVPFIISRYVYFLLTLCFASNEQLILEIRYFLEHFCYSSAFFAYSLYWWGHHVRQGAAHLLRSVRDDEYLIGRQLRNLEREQSSRA